MAHPGLPPERAVIPPEGRPALVAKARLRYDQVSGGYMLLYPERGLALNPTAAGILKLCDGELTVDAIVERLQRDYAERPEPDPLHVLRSFVQKREFTVWLQRVELVLPSDLYALLDPTPVLRDARPADDAVGAHHRHARLHAVIRSSPS